MTDILLDWQEDVNIALVYLKFGSILRTQTYRAMLKDLTIRMNHFRGIVHVVADIRDVDVIPKSAIPIGIQAIRSSPSNAGNVIIVNPKRSLNIIYQLLEQVSPKVTKNYHMVETIEEVDELAKALGIYLWESKREEPQ